MLTPYLKKLIAHEDLSHKDSIEALEILLTSDNKEQIAAFLVLMRAKGETAQEMTAFVQVMQDHQISVNVGIPVIDIVGTGGDNAQTFNISTAACILAASCDVAVLKHGNRAVSSRAGSADVLQALGLELEQTPEQVIQSLVQHKIGFCYAPAFHPALLAIKPIRHQLKVPTFFNLLGPLLNPDRSAYRLLGVFDAGLQQLMADILLQLNVTRAMVVYGNGLDELNCIGPCEVIEINHGIMHNYQIDPEVLGLARCTLDDLKGGSAAENAQILQALLHNKASPLLDTVVLNAAAAVY
ncbi:MAG TPA: anthranilate phosphoribosyltransferase, partial [Gammaproteobacteria bacterium]|nr:anthranilate phosphoribosyltransferase [Gammaproteobacteria bacterium]